MHTQVAMPKRLARTEAERSDDHHDIWKGDDFVAAVGAALGVQIYIINAELLGGRRDFFATGDMPCQGFIGAAPEARASRWLDLQCTYCEGEWKYWLPQSMAFEQFIKAVEICRSGREENKALVLHFTGNHFQAYIDPSGPPKIRASVHLPMDGLQQEPGPSRVAAPVRQGMEEWDGAHGTGPSQPGSVAGTARTQPVPADPPVPVPADPPLGGGGRGKVVGEQHGKQGSNDKEEWAEAHTARLAAQAKQAVEEAALSEEDMAEVEWLRARIRMLANRPSVKCICFCTPCLCGTTVPPTMPGAIGVHDRRAMQALSRPGVAEAVRRSGKEEASALITLQEKLGKLMQTCKACGSNMQGGGGHVCIKCKAPVHSYILCREVLMPTEGEYFCSQACLTAHMGGGQHSVRQPVARKLLPKKPRPAPPAKGEEERDGQPRKRGRTEVGDVAKVVAKVVDLASPGAPRERTGKEAAVLHKKEEAQHGGAAPRRGRSAAQGGRATSSHAQK